MSAVEPGTATTGAGTATPTGVTPTAATDAVELVVRVGPVAHGGHCVARHEGRVVFVRHALPGELVRVRLTDAGPSARYWRADAVEVVEDVSPDRVAPPWPEASATPGIPDGGPPVGGAELGHVALPAQRRWKGEVVREQFRRLAGLEVTPDVEGAPDDDARGGLGWRTRLRLVADHEGRAGMHVHRSDVVRPITAMPLASEEAQALLAAESVLSRRWRPGAVIDVVAPAGGGAPLLLVDGRPWVRGKEDRRPHARSSVTERVAAPDGSEHVFRVAAEGFWQVHRHAPALLLEAVLNGAGEVGGGRVLDLYSGAGLFTVPLAEAVGPSGRVIAIEGDERAVRDARRNAHAHPQAELHHGPVQRLLAAPGGPERADVVVLDPPRTGAGARVVDAVAALRPERIVYVACDPASLARDAALLAAGARPYALTGLRVLDLFPHTHHVESVAVFAAR